MTSSRLADDEEDYKDDFDSDSTRDPFNLFMTEKWN